MRRHYALALFLLTATPAVAQNVDIAGGPGGQTMAGGCTMQPHWRDVHFAPYSQLNNSIAQNKLAQIGYYQGPIHGQFDTASKSALQRFQVNEGILPANGVEDQTTIQQLAYQTNTVLSRGCR